MPFENIEDFIQKFSQVTEEYTFYEGTEILRYAPKEHIYYKVTATGLIPLPGVSTVAHIIDKSAALVPWAVKKMAEKLLNTAPVTITQKTQTKALVLTWENFEKLVLEAKTAHKEKLDEAGAVGHAAHAWIEECIKAFIANASPETPWAFDVPREDPRVTSCCLAALDWMSHHNVRWICTERKIFSRLYQYAGTMDGLCVMDSCGDPHCCPEPFTNRLSLVDWKCLLPEQTLVLEDGSQKQAKNVLPGDRLVSYCENSRSYVCDTVKSVSVREPQPALEVWTEHGRCVKVSSNHPFLVNGRWVEAESLQSGDELHVYLHSFSNTSSITVEEAQLLGYLVGDGGLSGEAVTITKKDTTFAEVIRQCASKCGFHMVRMSTKSRPTEYRINGARPFVARHGLVHKKSIDKTVPAAVMSGSREVVLAFLSAYFDCDGYIAKPGVRRDVYFSTSSFILSQQVLELLHRLGVNASVWEQTNKQYNGTTHINTPYWVKVGDKRDVKKLLSLLTLISHKKERRDFFLNQLINVAERDYDGTDRVDKVRSLGDRTTIAIEMCKVPTFITSGIVTHNTSNGLYIDFLFQSAAYEQAYEEEHGVDIVDRWVIRLGKEDAEFEPWHLGQEDFEDDFGAFLEALRLGTRYDRIEQRMKDRKNGIRQARRAEAKAAKEEALKLACANSQKYQGIRKPACNGGNPCESCVRKYQEVQAAKPAKHSCKTALQTASDRLTEASVNNITALMALVTTEETHGEEIPAVE